MNTVKVPQVFLQKIRASVSILDIVGEHVVLRKSGANYTGLCPFHSERTPSFCVSESKQLYHCYGCKRGGDLFTFVQEINGISFIESIKELAARAGLPIPGELRAASSSIVADKAKQEKISLAFKLNRFVAAFYHANLGKIVEAKTYVQSRGVGEELAKEFYVGVAHPSWDALARHLIEKKAPLEIAIALGVIRRSQKATKAGDTGYFDSFRNRVMFPILDVRGRVAGFGGRTLSSSVAPGHDAHGAHEDPKYLNSPDSPLFHKSRLLFGLFQAQKHIREKDEVILVEGYFDVLAMHAAGFKNVVSTCGTALTSEHLRILGRFASRTVILFDGDKAGIAATEKAMETGLENGVILYGAAIPDGRDPDEILFEEGGRERMQGILVAGKPILDEKIDALVRLASLGSEEKTKAIKQIGIWLGKYRDPVGRTVRFQTVSERMVVPVSLLEKSMGLSSFAGRLGNSTRTISRNDKPFKKPKDRSSGNYSEAGLSRSEKILLMALMRGGVFEPLFKDAGSKLPPKMTIADFFDHSPAKNLVRYCLSAGMPASGLSAILDEFGGDNLESQLRSTITEAVVSERLNLDTTDVKLALERASGRLWARFSQHIRTGIVEAEAKKDATLVSELMKEYLDVQRKIKDFSSFYDES